MRLWFCTLAVAGAPAIDLAKLSTSIEAVYGDAPLPSPNVPFLAEVKSLKSRVSASHEHALAAIASFRHQAKLGAQALKSIQPPDATPGAPAAPAVDPTAVKMEYDQLFELKKKVLAMQKQYEDVAAAVEEQSALAQDAQMVSTKATDAALKSIKLAESKLQSNLGETKDKLQGYMTKAQEIHAAAEEAKETAHEASAFAHEAMSLAAPAQEMAKDLKAKFFALRSQFPSIMDKLDGVQAASGQAIPNAKNAVATSVTAKAPIQFFEKESTTGKKLFLERSTTEKKKSLVEYKDPTKVLNDLNELRHMEAPVAQKTAAKIPSGREKTTTPHEITVAKKTAKTKTIANKRHGGSALLHQKGDANAVAGIAAKSAVAKEKKSGEARASAKDVEAAKEREKKRDDEGKKQKEKEERAREKKHLAVAVADGDKKGDVTKMEAEQWKKEDAKMKKIQRKKNAAAGARILAKKEQMRKNKEEQTRDIAAEKEEVVRKPSSQETAKEHDTKARLAHPHKTEQTKIDTQKTVNPVIATKTPQLAVGKTTKDKAAAAPAHSLPHDIADSGNVKSFVNRQRTGEPTLTTHDSWWTSLKNWFSPSAPPPALVVAHSAPPLKQNWLKTSRAVVHEGNHVVDISDAFSTLVHDDDDVIATQRARDNSEALLAKEDLGDDVKHKKFRMVNAMLLRPDVTPNEYAMLRNVQDESMAKLEKTSA
eukprot:GEMP01020275.1.p1 GENE.GEMP01020275.1~~GEMP01020275.1.p1  ORF type:complete len:708 (+),score=242.44 GEMP01020275.1:115-2238(+)